MGYIEAGEPVELLIIVNVCPFLSKFLGLREKGP